MNKTIFRMEERKIYLAMSGHYVEITLESLPYIANNGTAYSTNEAIMH